MLKDQLSPEVANFWQFLTFSFQAQLKTKSGKRTKWLILPCYDYPVILAAELFFNILYNFGLTDFVLTLFC